MRAKVLIPARGGSKGIPGKNTMDFCGKPLIVWSIEQAHKVGLEVFVSTDDRMAACIALNHGATIIERPEELAGDYIRMPGVIRHALQYMKTDTVVLLQPTNPLRRDGDIEAALGFYERNNKKYLASCYQKHLIRWKSAEMPARAVEGNTLRQDLFRTAIEHGLIYIYDTKCEPIGDSALEVQDCYGYVTEAWQSFELDEPEDIAPCEALMERMILNV